MRTAVDSSVLLDVLSDNPRHAADSERALRQARQRGALIVCPTVWAEVRAHFAEPTDMDAAMARAEIAFDSYDCECAHLAGKLWHAYRRAGGLRQRLIADFFIGAHAQLRAGRLLSRDRVFYRQYFPGLIVGSE